MPLYKGNTEIASGKLYKADTNIENGYKGTDSFYINEVTISFLNFPGVSDYSITGAPGDTIPGNRYQQWTVSANSGYAFNGTQTASGLPTDFTFSGGAQGSLSNTTTSPRVNYSPSTFPTSSVSVNYNDLTISLPQTQIVTYSYTFSGNLGRSTSCTTFAGSSCTVGSNTIASSTYGTFRYFTSSASGTGGYGANNCTQGCSVSISSSGGTSSCNSNTSTANATISAGLIGCGELNTYGVAADARSSGPACAHGGTISFYADGNYITNVNPDNTGSYSQYVITPSNISSYYGDTIIGYAKGVDVTSATYGGGDFVVSNPC